MTGVKQKPHPRRKSRKVQQPKNSPKEKLMKEPAGQDTDERSDLQVGSVVDPVLPSAKFEPEPPTVPLLTVHGCMRLVVLTFLLALCLRICAPEAL